ncbi:MAG: TolC family protein [Candidatus Poribacteria bacterium]|nr:TolC family protein [Candidatus Poribacteria bacterium]MDE0324935.1 TolC family protein [Candidatus Poribacteria bacterium]
MNKKIRINKRLTALAVWLLFSIVGVVSAQQLISLQPARAIELALQNNETVRKAEKVVERAKANLRVSKAIYLPQVGVTSEYQRQKNGDIDERDYLTRAQMSMLLAQFGEIPEALDIAQEEVRKAEIDYERAKKESVHAVRNLWHNIILTQEEIKQRRTIEIELDEKLAGTISKHEEKRIRYLSRLNTELELSEQRLALNELQRRLDVDTAELIRLTGLDPLAQVVLSQSLPDDDITLDDAVELALVNSLDLRDLRGDIIRQERLAAETLWNRFPELSAEARYKDLHLLLEQHQQNRTWDAKALYDPVIFDRERDVPSIFETNPRTQDGWEVRFNLNIPLYDGKKTANLRSVELAELERLQLEHTEKTKLIRVAVRRDYRAVANAKERMEIEETRLSIREQQLRTIERVLDEVTFDIPIPGYQGLTFTDAFQAQAQFTEAQRVFYQTRRDYAEAKEKLRETMQWIQ